VLGAEVHQGYGLTETAAAVTLASAHDIGTLHVGPPLVCSGAPPRFQDPT
jgi:long-subunit acyl-CoA synthetase (AMP-forming)